MEVEASIGWRLRRPYSAPDDPKPARRTGPYMALFSKKTGNQSWVPRGTTCSQVAERKLMKSAAACALAFTRVVPRLH